MALPKITIKDVAIKAGVSIATVSRFLNNPESLKESSRKKVEKVVKEFGYQPQMYARRLAGGKLNSFGLIMPGYEGIFYSHYALEIIRSAAISLERTGIDLHLHIFWNKDNFRSSLVDGVIFADIINNENQLKRVVKEGIPAVVINKQVDDPEIDVSYVAVNNHKAAKEAVEFLINHRHSRIAHLAGDLNVQCASQRLAGYKEALVKNGIALKEEYIKATNFSRKDAREKLEELFVLKEPPTALFCCSDEVANEALAFCEEKKIEVPREVSIIGFDDNPLCIYGNIMLTTVRQPLAKMAATAVDVLRAQVEGGKPQKIILDAELIIRDTVKFI